LRHRLFLRIFFGKDVLLRQTKKTFFFFKKKIFLKRFTVVVVFWGRLGVPLGRASGEIFFECFPNHYAKGFVGAEKTERPSIYAKFDTFFYALKYAVK
jgi:hypothetical protein